MSIGALTEYLDIAQVMLYVFWAFFFGLVVYLHRETYKEGYPLEPDPATGYGGKLPDNMRPPMQVQPKVFDLPHGGTASSNRVDNRALALEPTAKWPGAPLVPTGDPMADGVGPASWASREDVVDQLLHGGPKIVPLRSLPEFSIESRSADPRGMAVIGADGEVAGTVKDTWIDQMEMLVRYLEVSLDDSGKSVLLPINFADVRGRAKQVRVNSIYPHQFASVPGLKNPGQITLLEEEKIQAYYGGGTLYADARRAEPVI